MMTINLLGNTFDLIWVQGPDGSISPAVQFTPSGKYVYAETAKTMQASYGDEIDCLTCENANLSGTVDELRETLITAQTDAASIVDDNMRLRAENAELRGGLTTAREVLALVRPYAVEASRGLYDGCQGADIRETAKRRIEAIDALKPTDYYRTRAEKFDEMARELAAARKALEPFARWAPSFHDTFPGNFDTKAPCTVGDLRAAARAAQSDGGKEASK